MEEYKLALLSRPDMVEAYARLGILYSRDGMAEKAAEMFKRVLEIDPNDERAGAYLDSLQRR